MEGEKYTNMHVKKQHFGFMKKKFRELKSGAKSWSEITREDWQFIEAEKRFFFTRNI